MRKLRNWATASSLSRRPRAFALLGLGIGAGLSTSEITGAQCGDVMDNATGLVVTVRGARAREVRVTDEWRSAIVEAIAGGDADDWIFCPDRLTGGKNMVTNWLAKHPSNDVHPNVQRMRATWIVGKLRDGSPAVQLMRDAGVRSMSALSRFVPFVDAA